MQDTELNSNGKKVQLGRILTMDNIKIFIASSNDEFEERVALQTFLTKTNEITTTFGVNVIPEMWELKSVDFKAGMERKQNEYNVSLVSSNIAFFIFGKRVGKFTQEEFLKACEQVKSHNNLRMFVYFKDVEIGSMSGASRDTVDGIGDIIKLKEFIKDELQQVYGTFKSLADLLPIVSREVFSLVLPKLIHTSNTDPKIQTLISLYNETNRAYQIDKRDAIIEDAANSLFFLSKYNYTPKLDQTSFYDLCHKIIESTREGANINAISLMLKCEWDNSREERDFWADNREAVKRRVRLERIFIVSKNEGHRLKTNTQIKNHVELEQTNSSNFHSYVIEKETLQSKYPQLLEKAGKGFILINSPEHTVALLDEIPESGQRAKPIIAENQLKELSNAFGEIKQLAEPLKQYIEKINWSHCKKEMISIFVTTKCNLNCDYCFTNKNQDEHKGQTISLEFVKKGIDDYFKTEYMRHVRFFGAGEPTCEFELLKEIHRYAKAKGGDSVTFEIQTNGAFNDAVAKWLGENINIIWISCDGTPKIQDAHRPFRDDIRKSSQVIEKNIRIIKNSRRNSFVGVRSTITSENIMHQNDMIDYFYELGIRDVWVDPIFPSVGETVLTTENDFDTMLFAEEFLKATKYAHDKGMFYGSILTCNFNDSVNKHCRACIPVPHLTTDGYVSACDMALFGRDRNHMSKLIYGNWNEESGEINYNQSKIEYLQSRTSENMLHCEMCNAKEHCGGYCLGEVLNETGDIFGQKKSVCQAIRYLDNKIPPELRRYKYTHP